MKVSYIGNFEPEHSTENHVARALVNTGHDVKCLQENLVDWPNLDTVVGDADFVLWTSTKSLAPSHTDGYAGMAKLRVPLVGYHLDRWWGLQREHLIKTEPFFAVDLLVTADGGHDQQWEDAGISHHWMPPAVSIDECAPGEYREEYAHDVVFVGNWQGDYHQEWRHRHDLVRWLKRWGAKFYPEVGEEAIRGKDLRDLYASASILIGDSCVVGDRYTHGRPITRYCSDRIPETLGRGGFLLHPDTTGITDGGVVETGVHLVTWELGDWVTLDNHIEYYASTIGGTEAAETIAEQGRLWVLENHTYEARMRDLVTLLTEMGWV